MHTLLRIAGRGKKGLKDMGFMAGGKPQRVHEIEAQQSSSIYDVENPLRFPQVERKLMAVSRGHVQRTDQRGFSRLGTEIARLTIPLKSPSTCSSMTAFQGERTG